MTSHQSGIDDHDLHAWVDGLLGPEEHARVGARIASDPELAAVAEHLRQQNASLRALFSAELDRPVPTKLQAAASRKSAANRPWFRQAAGLAVVAALGMGAGWIARGRIAVAPAPQAGSVATVSGTSGLLRAAMVAHAAFAPEVRHPVEVGASEHEHLVAWLSRRIGAALKVPDLSGEGYALIGGRLLPDDSRGVAAQFMFENRSAQRLTLFVRRGPEGSDTGFRYAQQGDIGSFYWVDRSFGYALTGELPRHAMLSIASAVHRQIDP